MSTIILIMGAVLFGLSLAISAYVLFSSLSQKDQLKDAMRSIRNETKRPTGDREVALETPFAQRIISPIINDFLINTIAKAPPRYVESVRRKMVLAGKPRKEEVDKFLVNKVLGIIATPILFLAVIVFNFLNRFIGLFSDQTLPTIVPWGVFVLGAIMLLFGPDLNLKNRVEKRREEITNQLPDILDLLTISIEAGLGFEQAITRITEQASGPLVEEMGRMVGETRSGSSRADALRAMDTRIDIPEVKSFIMAVIQSDKFGSSIGKTMRAQADEARTKRRQYAEERAQKAPIKMLAPMFLLIFPVLFIVVLGPAAVQIVSGFGS